MGPSRGDGDLIPGTLDMLILKAVDRQARHGYAIAEFIRASSGSVLRVEEGALYPALHRLEVRGWLQSRWGVSENNRRAKFYRPSALGRHELAREADRWASLARAVTQVMRTT